MHYPIVLIIAVFFIVFQHPENGCPDSILVQTSNGITVNSQHRVFNHCDSVFIQGEDSISLFVKGGNCCDLKIIKITLNGSDVPYILKGQQGPCFNLEARLPGKPGNYVVDATLNFAQHQVAFDMVLDPVGINEKILSDEQVKVYPSPARNVVHIISGKVQLKTIDTYDMSGKKIHRFIVDGSGFKMPIEGYAPGVYFLYISTAGEQIVIRKITVL
jgi:hypothetical protein